MRRKGSVFACVVLVCLSLLLSSTSSVHGSLALTGTWTQTLVDSTNDRGQGVHLALCPLTGVPYISYYDATDNALRAGVYVGSGGNCGDGSWECVTVDDGGINGANVGVYNSISVNPLTGRPAIAYYSSTYRHLKYSESTCAGVNCTWNRTLIEYTPVLSSEAVGKFPSLKFGSDGIPRVAYQYTSMTDYEQLKYAEYVGNGGNCGIGSAWLCTVIESNQGYGMHPSLELATIFTPVDNPHIASYDSSTGNLRYTTYRGNGSGNCGGGDWDCWLIDSAGDTGMYPALNLPSHYLSYRAIAYLRRDTGELMVARNVSGGGNCGFGTMINQWQCDVIEDIGATSGYVDIALERAYEEEPIVIYGCPGCWVPGIFTATYVETGGDCGSGLYECETLIFDNLALHDYTQYLDAVISGDNKLSVAWYDADAGDVLFAMDRDRVYLPTVILE